MKTRIIQTRYWDDDDIYRASAYTKYLYIYLLTCQYINICGIFQLPVAKILAETKLTQRQFDQAEQELWQIGKVYFFQGWVWVVNAQKNNQYTNSPQNKIAFDDEMSKVPQSVINQFETNKNTTIDSSIDTTYKSEIRNKKERVIKGKHLYQEGEVTDEKCQEIADKYSVSLGVVLNKREDMANWSKADGKMKVDWELTLMTWIRNDIEKGTIKRIVKPAETPQPVELTPEQRAKARDEIEKIKEKFKIKSI